MGLTLLEKVAAVLPPLAIRSAVVAVSGFASYASSGIAVEEQKPKRSASLCDRRTTVGRQYSAGTNFLVGSWAGDMRLKPLNYYRFIFCVLVFVTANMRNSDYA